jgi:hypothetical protein
MPLLQEYAYDDYGVLAEFLSPTIVDVDDLTLRSDVLDNPEQLVTALHEAFAETQQD